MVARLTARRQGEKSKREKAVAGHSEGRKERERAECRVVGEAGKRRRKQDQGGPPSGAGASLIIAVSRVLSVDMRVPLHTRSLQVLLQAPYARPTG